MHCPMCGAEVVAEAAYCHKCGERIDMAGGPNVAQDVTPAGPADASAATGHDPEPGRTAAERFQQTVEFSEQISKARC